MKTTGVLKAFLELSSWTRAFDEKILSSCPVIEGRLIISTMTRQELLFIHSPPEGIKLAIRKVKADEGVDPLPWSCLVFWDLCCLYSAVGFLWLSVLGLLVGSEPLGRWPSLVRQAVVFQKTLGRCSLSCLCRGSRVGGLHCFISPFASHRNSPSMHEVDCSCSKGLGKREGISWEAWPNSAIRATQVVTGKDSLCHSPLRLL